MLSLKEKMLVLLLLLAVNGIAQQTISFDVAGIRNMRKAVNGLNVSAFYHFNERLIGGIEMNRFFSATLNSPEEELELSAWDFDLNFHYLLPVYKSLKLYPLTGISHTSEREWNPATKESHYDRFWSFNTGAGLLLQLGKWSPHIEYSYTWGLLDQQFLLAGISYELEWGHHGKEVHF